MEFREYIPYQEITERNSKPIVEATGIGFLFQETPLEVNTLTNIAKL